MTARAVAATPRAQGDASRLSWLRDRGMGASILVAAIATAFGAVLISATGFISAILKHDPATRDSETLAFVLNFIVFVLLAVAVYVAAIVTANTFATVIAGRTRRIALLRMIGATARSQRAEVARQGLVVGTIGGVLGLVAGVAISAGGVAWAERALSLDGLSFTLLQPMLLVPAIGVALTTWASAWAGSRRVLTVTPLQALGGSVEASHREIARRRGRNAVAITLIVVGALLLAAGIAAGLVTPLGVIVAFFGGVLSFTGLALGATLVMPPILRLVGRLFGGSATARLASENALRYPERSSRMAIGVVIGVTLVTMFAVATESVKQVFAAAFGGTLPPEFATVIDTFSGIMMGLVAVSAVIAAVGLVNLLTLGVVQRRREFGLLRALGLSNAQVRKVVLLEATHITVAAVATGLILGVFYGWAAAQSLLGSIHAPGASRPAGLVAPGVPLWPVAAIVVATAVLTLIAAVAPTRLATRVSPVAALAE
ncbi:ABC transporter permease [Microbacterium sp. ASV49]|uniref:ABC transporter permease n=1 Tax=Microbacterium candidum TaxID=3041922 RepID=A0ABT7MXL3_9MICO|nr:ABC transporter permease [Microbacterium sp. ASV49]MDL9979183.1 ABC transporter permease [Microbacterium sp. ASV49]